MKKKIITGTIAALLISGCVSEQHVSGDNQYFESISASFRGIDGVMPTIGKIYIDSVKVDTANDGDLSNMRKAALDYVLSADLIIDDYSILDGGKAECLWETTALGTSFKSGYVTNGGKNSSTALILDNTSGSYVCAPVNVSFTKEGTEVNYDPDSVVSLSFKDNEGNPIKRVGYDAIYTTSIVLNTADRHNILTVATSPTSVLYYRADGLFQAGFTAYRGLKGLEKYIGSATYEANIKAPGATDEVSTVKNNYADNVTEDNNTINMWLNGSGINNAAGIYSESAFVSSYGPPIALPPFRENLTEKDYRKLRLVLMRRNNFPIIISNDKKLYTMGRISNLTLTDRQTNYRFFIRNNDNWFQYSGVDVKGDYSDNKLHVGEIKIADGTPAKFVSTLSVTSDLGTIISLNEYDKEYYIAGNPFYNEGFCGTELATFDYETYSFNFDTMCSYNSSKKVGAVKIPGLQKLIGDGEGVLATDTHIYYSGNDGKMYQIDLLPTGENYTRIKQGLPVLPRVMGLDEVVDSPITDKAERDKLYAIDIGLPNMNPVLAPTLLMNDGSVVFTARTSDNTGKITYKRKHFYINEFVTDGTSKPGDLYNVPITNILGPTVGYGANGRLYYFTDVHALGISYAPNKKTYPEMDNDYLGFVFGDPVQQLASVNNKADFFEFKLGELNITNALNNVDNKTDIETNNFVLMPYNPYTDAVEDVSGTDENGNITLEAVPYRPFRTNTHLFVNMRAGAKYNYILVPHYAYAFSNSTNIEKVDWVKKSNGLMAAEVRDNDISKVFGAFKNPKIPFKYTPYGRNTAFFANKKGVFAFTDYDVRRIKNMCQNGTCTEIENNIKTLKDDKVPDYFYRAVSNGEYAEEASGRNNYISTPFVSETRMSNFPNNTEYLTKGFEPQLLSSWFRYETKLPNTSSTISATGDLLAGYVPQYFYSNMVGRTGISFATENGLETWLNNLYQYAYGAGMYHYYSSDTYPVWRARKLGTEVLQYQARYGTLIPMTHGATANYLFNNLTNYFKEGEYLEKGNSDSEVYVLPRIYTHAHYTFYDKDKLEDNKSIENVVLGGMDISKQSITKYFSDAHAKPTDRTLAGSGVGYIMDKGNYMWRANTPAANAVGKAVSPIDPMNKSEYFNGFVVVHK